MRAARPNRTTPTPPPAGGRPEPPTGGRAPPPPGGGGRAAPPDHPADPEEGRVAEGDEPGVAHQEVVGDGEEAEDHDLGGERHGGLDRAHEERQHQEPDGEPGQRVAQDAAHSNFSQRSPMRPRGRSRRMTAMRMYIDASAARGWK